MRFELPNAPWEEWVRRVVLHVPHFLSFDGHPTSGGRQRKVRDFARLILDKWGRECVVAQKATANWEREGPHGVPVIGVRARLDAFGDPGFGLATGQMLRRGDGIVYMGCEDAWPFFVRGAKGFHAGIWWDGPYPSYKKSITRIRTEALFRACRTVLCVDTNVINWLRAGSRRNQEAANRAIYVPNCAPLERVPTHERAAPGRPLRLLFARRFEFKRGPDLALDAVALLARRNVPVRLIASTVPEGGGIYQLRAGAKARGIEDLVETHESDLDSVFALYARADAAIVPTLWSEGTSYSCAEALAAGLPVVTTTVGGLPNLVFPGFNGFVTPPRPEPIAEAIEALTDPDTWLSMHRHCLSMRGALSKSTWERRVLGWIRA